MPGQEPEVRVSIDNLIGEVIVTVVRRRDRHEGRIVRVAHVGARNGSRVELLGGTERRRRFGVREDDRWSQVKMVSLPQLSTAVTVKVRVTV